MNILVVHEVDWLTKVVFEVHVLAELLASRGHTVRVVDYPSDWKRDGAFDFGTLRTRVMDGISRSLPGASVTLHRPGVIKVPGISRVSGFFTTYRVIKKLLAAGDIDVILLYSVPTSGWQTLRLARRYGVPVVFRSIDILHRLVRPSWLRPLTRAMETWVYRCADRILPIGPRYAKYVVAAGADPVRIRQVLMPVDADLFRPAAPPERLRERWDLTPGDRVVVFIGTLFPFSGLDRFLRAMPRLLERVPEARLLIVGDGEQRRELERIVREQGLDRAVTITGFQPYREMPDYINLADVCISTFPADDITGDTFPGKVIQYLAAGCPVVATPQRALTEMLPEEACVVYAADEGMAEAVADLLRDDERRARLGAAGTAYVMKTHTYDIIVQQLEEELAAAIAACRGRGTKRDG